MDLLRVGMVLRFYSQKAIISIMAKVFIAFKRIPYRKEAI